MGGGGVMFGVLLWDYTEQTDNCLPMVVIEATAFGIRDQYALPTELRDQAQICKRCFEIGSSFFQNNPNFNVLCENDHDCDNCIYAVHIEIYAC